MERFYSVRIIVVIIQTNILGIVGFYVRHSAFCFKNRNLILGIPAFCNSRFSTTNFSTTSFKNSWLKSLGLKKSWSKNLGLKGKGLKLGLKNSGMRCPLPLFNTNKEFWSAQWLEDANFWNSMFHEYLISSYKTRGYYFFTRPSTAGSERGY